MSGLLLIRFRLIKQEVAQKVPMPMTEQSLAYLFKHNDIPPEFAEILVNNNGAHTSSVEYGADGITPAQLRMANSRIAYAMMNADNMIDLFVKHPSSASLSSAVHFRYDFGAKTTAVVIFGTYLEAIEDRLLDLFARESVAAKQGIDDPFVVLSAIMAEYSSMMEYERRHLDFLVRDQESKTGVAGLHYDESLRAQAVEYGDLVRSLHTTEGFLMFFERVLDFQIGLLKFLEEQHRRFQDLFLSCGENIERNPMTLRVGDSLRQSLSLTTHRLEQVKTLDRRIQIQLRVVSLSDPRDRGIA